MNCALLVLTLVFVCVPPCRAGDALIAVATNFSDTARKLQSAFESSTGHRLTLTFGSTGKLYAQITHGAPYDAFLAADRERPARLLESGSAIAGSMFNYASGRLVLWSPDQDRIPGDGRDVLRSGRFSRLAIANPRLAPYGAAARETLLAIGCWEALRGRIVMGENVGQAHTLVATGAAELGFVALSHLRKASSTLPGSHWVVPAELHGKIEQTAVLLRHGDGNAAARDYLEFLQTAAAHAVIVVDGYGVE